MCSVGTFEVAEVVRGARVVPPSVASQLVSAPGRLKYQTYSKALCGRTIKRKKRAGDSIFVWWLVQNLAVQSLKLIPWF
jgi:hypothetical protein